MVKTNEWITVYPTDYMTFVPIYQCSVCKGLTFGYKPDSYCIHCGSVDCGGSCHIEGNVTGNIDAFGSVTCGDVGR